MKPIALVILCIVFALPIIIYVAYRIIKKEITG